MATSILVTGGTGTLGRPVAQRLRDAGASVTVLSRHPRETAEGIRYTTGDLSTGEGIEAAVRGAEVIVHCAGSSKGDEQKTRTLVSAATGARHILLISVVGADRIPQVSAIDRALFGYFGMKLATERVVEQSGIGWTTLRATQFHDLILMVARALAKLPVIPAPTGSRFQPGSRCRQADVGGIPGRPDLDGTQNLQIRSSSRVDIRQVSADQNGGSGADDPRSWCRAWKSA